MVVSSIFLSNIYGRHDNFGPESTVIASLIKRLFGEKEHPLVCWGDGSPIRDFIYAGDIADGIIKAYEQKLTQPINLGSGTGVTIVIGGQRFRRRVPALGFAFRIGQHGA